MKLFNFLSSTSMAWLYLKKLLIHIFYKYNKSFTITKTINNKIFNLTCFEFINFFSGYGDVLRESPSMCVKKHEIFILLNDILIEEL